MHGEEGLKLAQSVTKVASPGSDATLDVAAIEAIAGDMPNIRLKSKDALDVKIVDLITAAGFMSSKGGGDPFDLKGVARI